ncbi:MAG: methylmalonyl Co-A mutase-associated GTPase MeaB [Herpetosiphon sp.]
MGLIDQLLAGNRRSLARAISIVENGGEDARAVLMRLYQHTGHGHLIGVTGPPGAGKSTLVNGVALEMHKRGQSVAIVAVDPSSPFSGGAILGDRIRMQPLSNDERLYVRSMASRGQPGGIARATGDVVTVLDAAGFDVVIVETVGAGQAEVEIVRQAQTTIVVEVPGLGDDVQAIKAGILEIADLFVVNKADREDASKTVRQLHMMLQLGHPRFLDWDPPILSAVATSGRGIPEIVDAIALHRTWLGQSGHLEEQARERARREVEAMVGQVMAARIKERVPAAELDTLIDQVRARQTDPYRLASDLIDRTFTPSGDGSTGRLPTSA